VAEITACSLDNVGAVVVAVGCKPVEVAGTGEVVVQAAQKRLQVMTRMTETALNFRGIA
jgi:hypothetical protein